MQTQVLSSGPSILIKTCKFPRPFRSYKKHLTTGDRALADGKLDAAEENFVSALRQIHDPNKPDRCKEAECLCRLGDVYVQRGKRTKEGRKFTQAAALYNAAMARTDKNKHSMTNRLQEIEQWFLHYTANVQTKPVPSDSVIRHKKRLEETRMRAKSQLDVIDQQHNPYQYDEDDPVMITVEAERAEAVKALFKNIAKDRQVFIEDLVNGCIAILGPPPCKYAFIGMGSQATELVTPYSDLEFAILIEEGNDSDVTRRYFLNLTHYLHLKVINLGETILPSMAIPSLNDFPEKDWFFDSVTPRGFTFDGFMPWASKTPFGRDQTKTKPPVSLIQTPAEMAKFQRRDVSVAEGYHLSDILRRVVFLTGEEALVTEYMTKLKEIITGDLLSRFQSRLSAAHILWESREQISTFEPTGQLLNVKKDIYRFPGIAIEVLALCCQITLASTWDVINELKQIGKIHEEDATHLLVLASISAELRLRTYFSNGGQQDRMSPLTQMKFQSKSQEVSDTTLRRQSSIPPMNVEVEYLDNYFCLIEPNTIWKKHCQTLVAT
ncbi:Hypp9230 [Branchiostoma lanceolatum]|uniref:Hypp9230 protein n=1 Tax=Branchiostoma lanceolatum TaxID=7740 RepID=A0A8J9ZCS7_BRALA|nr:Hypp9230 [Branchiostoma lanceolatum]